MPIQLSQPPRNVSPTLALQMCLGGVGAQIGWLLFAFGSIFFWAFAWHADLSGWRFRGGQVSRVAGEVLHCRETSYSVGGDDGGGTPVVANEYHYTVDGASIGGVSYDTGSCALGEVTVEYLTAKPEYSRIQGMRRDVMGPWALIVAVVPAAGLALVVAGWRKGLLRGKLLRDGVSVTGHITELKPTGGETMGRADLRATVAFTARDGIERSVKVVTSHPEKLKEDGGPVVLYDPAEPSRALPPGSFPGTLRQDHSGSLVGGALRRLLVLPVLSLLVNAWFLLRNW